MSLEKSGSTFLAACDFCGNYMETDETDFLAAVDRIKSVDWKVYKNNGEWFHKCWCCQMQDGEKDFEVLA